MSNNCIISPNGGIDPLWNSVSFLLSANDAAGSTDIKDHKGRPIKLRGSAAIQTVWSLYGDGSLNVSNKDNSAYVDSNLSDFDFGSGDFTVEFALYPLSGAGSFGVILGKWMSGGIAGNAWAFLMNADRSISFIWSIDGTNPVQLTSAATYPYNTAMRISIVRNGTSIKMYVNGVQAAAGTITGSINVGTAWFEIGAYRNGISGTFAGYVDELRVTKAARYTANYPVATGPFPNQ